MRRFPLPARLAGLALLLATPPAAAQRDAPAHLVASARAVTPEIAAIRGLEVLRPVDFRVSDRATVRGFARDALAREMTPAQWAANDALLAHVGLVPPGTDLRALLGAMYVEQIAGYYDPARGAFYLADWLPELLQRAVVAHEVTHALQDQHFDLARWLAAVPPTEDGALARVAVAEGDAMATMLAYLLVPTGVPIEQLPTMRELLGARGAEMRGAYPTFDEAPPALQRLLLFPYVEGADFVADAVRRGGWDAVDRLYREPPASTEQILHPARYWETADPPRALGVPGDSLAGTALSTGSWGELGVELILAAGLRDSAAARVAAAGWGGDRYALRRRPDGRLDYAWSTAWDSPARAARFFEAYTQAVVRRYPRSARLVTGENRFRFAGSGRTIDVVRSDDRVEVREIAPAPRAR